MMDLNEIEEKKRIIKRKRIKNAVISFGLVFVLLIVSMIGLAFFIESNLSNSLAVLFCCLVIFFPIGPLIPYAISDFKLINELKRIAIDEEVLVALNTAERTGIKIDPKIIRENRMIIEHKVKQKNTIICVAISGSMFVATLIAVVIADFAIFIIGILIGIIVSLPFAISRNKLKQNACPICFAISPWIHLDTTEIGRQRTTITKEVETKHYAPAENRRNHIFESTSGVQYYQGKSVTKVNVPAVRYDYKSRYRCKCCGGIRDVHTHAIEEQ